MNTNLPVPIESSAVPYVRPHDEKKRGMLRPFVILALVIGLLASLVLGYRALPEEIRVKLGGFFVSETTATTIGETTTAPDMNGTTAPNEKPTDIYEWNFELPQGATAILPIDYSANTLLLFAENPTDAVLEAIMPTFPKKGTEEISVLIVDSRSFESYAEEGTGFYTEASFATNGADERRVRAVAEVLSETLNENGVGALFIDCMAESAFGSSQNAKQLLSLAMEDHPEAVLVIDIRRAVLTDEKGALLRPVTEIAGDITAQVRILLGTGANFEENAATALSFYETANLTYPSLMMPLSVSENSFLQSLSLPVLTFEVGSAGNSVSEAKKAAALLGGILAKTMVDP